MRIWTLHPQYLDAKGLVALWRETLLAQAVLAGNTRGYQNHPQLVRFRAQRSPLSHIASYLYLVHEEASRRNYHFDRSRIIKPRSRVRAIEETDGQLHYEWQHLMGKLKIRDPERVESLSRVLEPRPHPLFCIVPGAIRDWEKQ
jgi:hypothetical protein